MTKIQLVSPVIAIFVPSFWVYFCNEYACSEEGKKWYLFQGEVIGHIGRMKVPQLSKGHLQYPEWKDRPGEYLKIAGWKMCLVHHRGRGYVKYDNLGCEWCMCMNHQVIERSSWILSSSLHGNKVLFAGIQGHVVTVARSMKSMM